MSVIGLELAISDPVTLRRLDRQWEVVFRLRRALQRDAAARCRAYWAAHRERDADPKALRQRLGLSRKGMEAAAKAHIEASGWMRDHLTKAIGLHVADEVWQSVDRHLFTDVSGRRAGPPRVGSWWEFTRIPGRARSHTKTTPTWETYRLAGTLDGHLDTLAGRAMPAPVGCRCALTATTPSRSGISAPVVITPPPPAAPARPKQPALSRSPHRLWLSTVTPSPSKTAPSPAGQGCGAAGSLCLVLACSSLP
jgi:hypothetical protein